jgi:hypothetical protein
MNVLWETLAGRVQFNPSALSASCRVPAVSESDTKARCSSGDAAAAAAAAAAADDDDGDDDDGAASTSSRKRMDAPPV